MTTKKIHAIFTKYDIRYFVNASHANIIKLFVYKRWSVLEIMLVSMISAFFY